MLHSMTGYGKGIVETTKGNIVVEIKSLNGKNTDVRIKYPSGFAEKELSIRNTVLNELKRGKIDVTIVNDAISDQNMAINKKLFKDYYAIFKELADDLKENYRYIFPSIARIPNVIKETEYSLSEEDWVNTQEALDIAISKIQNFREQEGQSIFEDIFKSVSSIQKRIPEIESLERNRKDIILKRLDSAIEDIKEKNKVDKNRYEQEVMYYLEKLDINEEKQRLNQHCSFFIEVLKDDTIVLKGKKLTFISQEIGREINTLGAKAQYSPLQKIVVELKENLEKIKEQLANVL